MNDKVTSKEFLPLYFLFGFLVLSRWRLGGVTKRNEWVKVAQSCLTLWSHGLYSPWNSPGQNTGVGSLSLLQGIFPTQGLNLGLLHCRWILYQLSHKGSPRRRKVKVKLHLTLCNPTECSLPGFSVQGIFQVRVPEWVAISFSSGSSRPRERTLTSRIAGRRFTLWPTREGGFEQADALPSELPRKKSEKWSRLVVSNSLRPHGL